MLKGIIGKILSVLGSGLVSREGKERQAIKLRAKLLKQYAKGNEATDAAK